MKCKIFFVFNIFFIFSTLSSTLQSSYQFVPEYVVLPHEVSDLNICLRKGTMSDISQMKTMLNDYVGVSYSEEDIALRMYVFSSTCGYFLYVAESRETNELVGFVAGSISHSFGNRRQRMRVDILYVKPEYRQCGVASYLIQAVESLAERSDVGVIETVYPSNRSEFIFEALERRGYSDGKKIYAQKLNSKFIPGKIEKRK